MAPVRSNRHGGDVHAASRELQCDVAQVLDFSASINPLGPSPRVWRAINRSRPLLEHYPDPECLDLRRALAEQWGCEPRHIVVGNGSMELIAALPRALKMRHLAVVQPTFSEYAASMARSGGRVTTLFASRDEGYRLPVERLMQLMKQPGTGGRKIDGLVLCNPNSPTGQACTAEEVWALATAAQRRGVWLIVDESFVDFCPERSVLPLGVCGARLIVLRSFTKFYGLPGLRAGYAVAAPRVVESIRRALPPWSVNMMAQVAALAALHDTAHVTRTIRFVIRERTRFARALSALPDCVVYPSTANFVFLEMSRPWSASIVTARLRREGILVRDCSSVPGATVRSVRVAVRRRRENDRLVMALARLLGTSTS